jgi:hypothetical protein
LCLLQDLSEDSKRFDNISLTKDFFSLLCAPDFLGHNSGFNAKA